jgi:5'-nucleotidase
VTVVAPAKDRSVVGRALSHEVHVEKHGLGYAVSGTPADSVVVGVNALELDPDLVIAGCNKGANLGEYVLGRSGTVSAAVEAAFFDIPAIAVSLYIPADNELETFEATTEDFSVATRAVRYLGKRALDVGTFEHADYLNINAPLPADDGTARSMEITRPSHFYDMDAVREGERISIRDRIWEHMAEGNIEDPEGTDRRAVVEGRISVSPLTAPHSIQYHRALDGLAEPYEELSELSL